MGEPVAKMVRIRSFDEKLPGSHCIAHAQGTWHGRQYAGSRDRVDYACAYACESGSKVTSTWTSFNKRKSRGEITRKMAGIVSWVSERLHEILGLSDRQIAEFMIELARKSKSSRDLTKKLQKSGTIEVNSDVEGFAAELWSRCVEGTSGKQSAERSGKQVTVDEKSRATKASRNIRSQRATEEWESDEEDVRPPSGADDSDSDEWERFAVHPR